MISIKLNQYDHSLLLQLMNECINGIGLNDDNEFRENEYFDLFLKIKSFSNAINNNFQFSIMDLNIIDDAIYQTFLWLTFDFSTRLGLSKTTVKKWIEKINKQTTSQNIMFCDSARLNMNE